MQHHFVQLAFVEIKRLVKFGIVGVLATLVHMGCSMFFMSAFSMPLQISNISGFLIAFCFSFTGQYFWTFQSTTCYKKAALKFFLVAFGGYLASAALLALLDNFSDLSSELKLVSSILIIPGITYLLGKYYAFK